MGLIKLYFKTNLLYRILAGLILGSLCGIIWGPAMGWVAPFGEIFIRMLKMIVVPIILFTLTVGAASVHPSQLGRVGAKAMGIYMVTTAFAVVFGLVIGNIFKPGRDIKIVETAAEGLKTDLVAPSLVDTLINIIPTNPFDAIAQGNILQVIVFCLLFGIGLSYVRNNENEAISNSGETVFRFFNGGAEIMYLVVNWILQYAPIGVFALIAEVFAKQGAEAFGPLIWTVMAVYLGMLGHMAFVYGGLLMIFGISPGAFYKKAKEQS